MDLVDRWLAALEERHMKNLRFQDVRRAVQALSSLYVERRERIGGGSALDGEGKRAAFAMYFSPLRFLLIREIARALDAAASPPSAVLDLGCGTGVAGAAWALETQAPAVRGIDIHPWAVRETLWTYRHFGLHGTARAGAIEKTVIPPPNTTMIAAFTINELPNDARDRVRALLLDARSRGCAILIIEPIARRLTPWWDEWAQLFGAAGGREDSWRFPVTLPGPLARMDKAAGLNHRELKGRSIWAQGQRGKEL